MKRQNGVSMKQSRVREKEIVDLPQFSNSQLISALFHVQDTLERTLTPFVVLGNTARHMYNRDEPLTGDTEIHIGVKKSELTREVISTIKTLIPTIAADEYQWSYMHYGVPVVIDVIHNEYKFLQHPEMHHYYISDFMLPNPFQKYWLSRNLVK